MFLLLTRYHYWSDNIIYNLHFGGLNMIIFVVKSHFLTLKDSNCLWLQKFIHPYIVQKSQKNEIGNPYKSTNLLKSNHIFINLLKSNNFIHIPRNVPPQL